MKNKRLIQPLPYKDVRNEKSLLAMALSATLLQSVWADGFENVEKDHKNQSTWRVRQKETLLDEKSFRYLAEV